MPSTPFFLFAIKVFQNVKISHHKMTLHVFHQCLIMAYEQILLYFSFSPLPSCSASVYSPPLLLCCWVLSPCYILFTLIKTLCFTGTQSAWVSLTHLSVVTMQSPVYILPCTHRPPSFHSCEGHRWRKEGGGEGRYQINPLGQRDTKGHHITTTDILIWDFNVCAPSKLYFHKYMKITTF